eukprot:TRINITY_DN1981_c6_g1_i1.p2 TRINITY_DN1981_c6_g1~~TRINITY_DN1981_c6_g1_i1.p2  ORF type:complete len:125 (-),score=4.53 TRINITY_DN1981_c6_g1_i1:677-1051(-)
MWESICARCAQRHRSLHATNCLSHIACLLRFVLFFYFFFFCFISILSILNYKHSAKKGGGGEKLILTNNNIKLEHGLDANVEICWWRMRCPTPLSSSRLGDDVVDKNKQKKKVSQLTSYQLDRY